MVKLTDFGKAARKYRVDHDMRLKDMAANLGVSMSHLSGVERGHKVMLPTCKTAQKLPPILLLELWTEHRSRLEQKIVEADKCIADVVRSISSQGGGG